MILFPKSLTIVLFVLFCVSIIALGVFGYSLLGDVGSMPAETLEVQREQFLYISLVCFSVIAVSFLFFAGRTRYISKELDKMIELNKYGDFSPELSMKKLGKIGEKITLLYFRLNALNEKKSLKISALYDLVEFLVGNTDLPMLVTDVQGKITSVSRSYTEKYEQTRTELMGRNIVQSLPDIPFQDIIIEMDKKGMSIDKELGKIPISIFPVFNYARELSYLVWIFERPRVVAEVARRTDNRVQRPKASTRLKRAFTRKRKSDDTK
jgi:PAS domain-containing protein